MGTADEYRLRAEELEHIASGLPTGGDRDQYVDMARQWRLLQAAAEATYRRGS